MCKNEPLAPETHDMGFKAMFDYAQVYALNSTDRQTFKQP